MVVNRKGLSLWVCVQVKRAEDVGRDDVEGLHGRQHRHVRRRLRPHWASGIGGGGAYHIGGFVVFGGSEGCRQS